MFFQIAYNRNQNVIFRPIFNDALKLCTKCQCKITLNSVHITISKKKKKKKKKNKDLFQARLSHVTDSELPVLCDGPAFLRDVEYNVVSMTADFSLASVLRQKTRFYCSVKFFDLL